MDQLHKVTVVLPSLDPDEKLLKVIDGLLERGFSDIILIDDGSKPENRHFFEDAQRHPEVHLLTHGVNRGKGAALKTGFAWFLENRPGQMGVVTVDGDNQHHPDDTKACALHMLKYGLLTLGVRDFSLPHVPERSRKGNRITSRVFKLFCGMEISDTQTGLRAIPREQLKALSSVKGERFEYETNMLLALKENGIPFDEVKIRTVYIEENKSSHFRVVRDSWRIYKLILGHFLKYSLSSLASFVVDSGMFYLLTWIFGKTMEGFVLSTITTVGARLISALVNFYLNKKLVFHSQMGTGKALLRYCSVALPILLLQVSLNWGICGLFGVGEEQTGLRTLIHVCVMTALFIASFIVQQRWVFHPKRNLKKEGKSDK